MIWGDLVTASLCMACFQALFVSLQEALEILERPFLPQVFAQKIDEVDESACSLSWWSVGIDHVADSIQVGFLKCQNKCTQGFVRRENGIKKMSSCMRRCVDDSTALTNVIAAISVGVKISYSCVRELLHARTFRTAHSWQGLVS